jgi:hypothetical protein
MAEITVRMYRNILGDCFLIRARHDGKPWHALIDFGILQGSPGRAESSDSIVASIGETTSWTLDLLIVTHEHADHISGFGQERQQFFGKAGDGVKVFDIGAVWLAWTEKLDDPQAKLLHETRRIAGSAVKLVADAAARLGLAGADATAQAEAATVAGLARFLPENDAFDDDGALGLDVDLSGRFTGARVMDALRRHPRVSYLEPGQMHAAGPMRAHVLGPPRGEAFLARSDPRSGAAREVYLTDPDRARALAGEIHRRMEMMGAAIPEAARSAADTGSPFAARYHRPIDAAVAEGDPVAIAYTDPDNSWRLISAAYLNAASELALQLDSDTNNTSLVLAFELPDGQIMLFPADAQVGNWLSWGEQTYPHGQPGAVDIANILSRVTLYKVGHHASHNATLRERGLELMTDPRLSAMIPVDREVAKTQEWAFPFPDLEKRLLEKTGRRLVMGDGKVAEETAAFAGSTHARVAHAPGPEPLWVEITLPIGGGGVAEPVKPRRTRRRRTPAG